MEMSTALTLPDEQEFSQSLQAINRFQKTVHANLVAGQDYGVIPGTDKPTLLKPGAEKIAKLLGLADRYELMDRQEDWQRGFFRYIIKCSLVHVNSGVTVSEGLGECNSMEGKYRWRESKRQCPVCGAEAIIKGKEEYGGGWLCFKKQGGCGAKFKDGDASIEEQKVGRVENDDIYTQVNTILKMAKKRAMVDASLSAGRLSNIFTQDIEDMGHTVVQPDRPTPSRPLKGEVVEAEVVDQAPTPVELPKGEPLDPDEEKNRLFAQFQDLIESSFNKSRSTARGTLEKKVGKPFADIVAEDIVKVLVDAKIALSQRGQEAR